MSYDNESGINESSLPECRDAASPSNGRGHPPARPTWPGRAALLLLIAALTACGGDDEAPADATESLQSQAATGADSTPPSPAEPTSAEIAALASRIGITEPVARALLIATAPLELSPSNRARRLSTMAADFETLSAELQIDAEDATSDAASVAPTDRIKVAVAAALEAGDFAGARSAVAKATADARARSADSLQVASLRAAEGQIALLQGGNTEAADLFQAALGGVSGDEALILARLVGLLGLAQTRDGQLEDARMNLEQAVRLRKAHLGNGHPDLAAAFERLADCYWAEGKYGNAEKLYQRALSIWQNEATQRTVEISRTSVRIRDLQQLQGKPSTDTGREST